jgi:alpha-tubulin suppressor-like RCC1 family protein
LRANGSLVCWGSNFGGQLGDGTAYDRTSPVRVIGL